MTVQVKELEEQVDSNIQENAVLLDAYNCYKERKQEQILVLLNNIKKYQNDIERMKAKAV